VHELAVCQALLAEVSQIARAQHSAKVLRVLVRLGPLSGVEARLLARAYPLAQAGTVAENSELVIEEAPVHVRCRDCGAESAAQANRLLCKDCGSWKTEVTSGDEMLLVRVELEQAADASRPNSDGDINAGRHAAYGGNNV
jgi:hydrogenase nickel incorporation protein HypA/HybF